MCIHIHTYAYAYIHQVRIEIESYAYVHVYVDLAYAYAYAYAYIYIYQVRIEIESLAEGIDVSETVRYRSIYVGITHRALYMHSIVSRDEVSCVYSVPYA